MPAPCIPLPSETIEKVRALVAQMGERPAGLALGLSPLTVARILAGFPVTRGTLLQLERTFAS